LALIVDRDQSPVTAGSRTACTVEKPTGIARTPTAATDALGEDAVRIATACGDRPAVRDPNIATIPGTATIASRAKNQTGVTVAGESADALRENTVGIIAPSVDGAVCPEINCDSRA
jgi:hypothetical protein